VTAVSLESFLDQLRQFRADASAALDAASDAAAFEAARVEFH
jgi:hypothetical protein